MMSLIIHPKRKIMKTKIMLSAMILMLSMFALTMRTNAQAPAWLWAVNAGDNSYDEAYTVALDPSGNIYVGGYFNSYIFDLPLSQGQDAFLAIFEPDGTLTWTGGISDTGTERITNIAFDKLGNYYVLGMYDGNQLDICSEHFVNSNPNAYNIFLGKFDCQHNCIWVRQVDGPDEDTPAGLAVDSIGNCYITGYFNSATLTFESEVLTNSGGGNADLFVAKYSPSGSVLWARSAAGKTGSFELSKSIAIDKLGNSYITGYFNCDTLKFDAIALKKVSNINMFAAKFAPNGAALWAMRADCNGDSYGYAVTVDAGSNLFVTGSFKSNLQIGDTTLNSAGMRDVFIAKYSPVSTVLWASSAGSTNDDEPSAVVTDKLGYCNLTGFFKSPSIDFGTGSLTNNSNAGLGDIFVMEYDAYGVPVWAKSIGGLTNDYPNAIIPDENRDFIIAATLGSTSITIGDTTLYNAGTVDALIVKSANTPATGISDVAVSTAIKVYPNPANDYVVFNAMENSLIGIYDLQGQLCRSVVSSEAETRVDISSLQPGIYVISVGNEKSSATYKLVKM